ncbi:MAG: S8 family serine peptidase [Flavobacteriales bacterium]
MEEPKKKQDIAKKKYLVFQGGGGKGNTYFGVLEALQSKELNNTLPLRPEVIVATLNAYAELFLGANDPHYNNGNSAGLRPSTSIPDANINIEPAWDYETGDSSIIVGIYDSGIHNSHGDISNGTFSTSSVKAGYNYVSSSPITSMPNPDDFGHGSAVAGIIGAWRNNSFGIAGVAGGDNSNGGVSLHDMKIFSVNPSGCGITATFYAGNNQVQQAIIEGIYAVGDIPKQQDIMNHSWGGINADPLIREAFITAYRNSIISSVAAGNSGCSFFSYPASFKDNMVMKVGANDATGARASFSECGFGLDFIAPGTHDLYIGLDNSGSNLTDSIQHPNPGCPDGALDGTSFAAPHASGVVALMLGYYKKNVPTPDNILAPEDCEELIQRHATDIVAPPNSPGYDFETGWGRLNAGAIFDSLHYPKFLVKHYEFNTSTSGATLVGSSESACLEQSLFGLPVGKLEFRIKRWQVTASASHSLPSGYNLIDGWARGSESENIAGINSAPGAVNCNPTCLNCNYMPDAPNPIVNSGSITPSGITMTGYIYELLDTNLNTVGWWPADTNAIATFAYSLYLVNPTVSVEELSEPTFNMFPNPTDNSVTIQLGNINEKSDIIITNITGQVVKVISGTNDSTIIIPVNDFADGMYFVTVSNPKVTITKKLIVKH